MSWAKFDDQYPDHPKVVQVGPLGMALHVAATCYCARYLTDGFVPATIIGRLVSFDGISIDSNAVTTKQVIEELTRAGLLEVVQGGYMVHDYLMYNPSGAQVKAERTANAERQKEWREAHRSKNGRFDNNNGDSNGVTNCKHNTAPSPSPSPSPTPQTRKGKGKQESEENSAENRAALFDIVQALAEVCGMDFEANKGRLFREGKPLVGKLTPEELRKYYGPRSTWYTTDWRGKMGEYPTPATIRETFERARNGNGKAPVNQGYREQY